MRLMRTSRVPTVAICMGEFGQASRILAGKFGAPFSYATFSAERTMAPGQLTYQQMKEVYRYESVNPETEVYAVIADPVAHSLSPHIHNAGFGAAGLNKVYVPFRVRPEDLGQFVSDCREYGIKGISVTIPHKEEILKYKSKCDEQTDEIGACNTLIWRDEDRIAFNTDYRAAMASIDDAFGGDETNSGLRAKAALVLGAGGAARAIVVGLRRRKADITIASRTMQRADDLARFCGGKSIAWGLRDNVKPDLIVNCTPVGMHPHVDESPIDPKHLHKEMVVFDTVYNPEQTLLIKQAREAGCTVITGVEMFVGQAGLQYKLFTGQEPNNELMRQVLRRTISAARN
jgi:3-dehydroquinate dehydratase/shikimate dehydrogenase